MPKQSNANTAQRSSSRPWLIGVLLISLMLGWWQWTGTPDDSKPQATGEGAGLEATPEPIPKNVASLETAMSEDPISEDKPTALEQYKEITRYPPTTRRLDKNAHDLLEPGARYEQRQLLPGEEVGQDAGWEVLYTADRYFVRGAEPVLITLQLWNKGKAIVPGHVVLQAQPSGTGSQLKPVSLKLQTDGLAKTAVFKPDDHWPDYTGQVRVKAEFSADGLNPRSGSLDFFFTSTKRIPARFTGEFSDRLGDGDLLIDVGMQVIKGGRFRVDGNLFDNSGVPFGWARFEGELQPGTTMATLRYYGLLFHDVQPEGPYVLKGLHGYRLLPGESPGREGIPAFESGFTTTGHYQLTRFRSDINDSPRRQKMIRMYEDAERRGVRLTEPEYTGDG